MTSSKQSLSGRRRAHAWTSLVAVIVPAMLTGCAAPPDSRSPSDNAASAPASPRPGITGDRAKALYERLKTLHGAWQSKSTKGWGGKIQYETIAGGSCVMETDAVAHPDAKMLSLYVLDIDRIVLTHYCAARNQPRLVATDISDDASRATFTFMDATNLPSRDVGHMDSMVIRFDGPDAFTSQWTWYGKGQESWMEEIQHRRITD
ncbi:MAG: hypothetical protein IT435_00080 [Phycisphaerales bacterium]|nr:hypothetical protein [Phycisphaerales bacterium]